MVDQEQSALLRGELELSNSAGEALPAKVLDSLPILTNEHLYENLNAPLG